MRKVVSGCVPLSDCGERITPKEPAVTVNKLHAKELALKNIRLFAEKVMPEFK